MCGVVHGVITVCEEAVGAQWGHIRTSGPPRRARAQWCLELVRGLQGSLGGTGESPFVPGKQGGEGRSQEWPGGKEGVGRKVRRRPAGMGVTEGVKEGGDTQICILGKPLGASREQTGGK